VEFIIQIGYEVAADETARSHRNTRVLTGLPLLFVIAACSASNGQREVHFGMTVELPPGTETSRCQLVTMPIGESYVIRGAHHYTAGSHHLLLMRTDFSSIPPGGDQVQDCNEGFGGTLVSHVRGVLYGAEVPQGTLSLPDGVAYKMSSQEVLLLQVHYLNASPNSVRAAIDVGLTTVTDASKVKFPAGNLAYYDPFIDVPPNAMAKAGARCTLTRDITLSNIYPHYHARGTGFDVYIDRPGEPPSTLPFYHSTDWQHPTPYQNAPLTLAAGSAIRFYCTYENSGNQEYFQGPSAINDEMCTFTGTYYPTADTDFEFCLNSFDRFGVGDQTCAQTSTCLQQCPSMAAQPTPGGISDCWQKCFVNSCPAASAPLLSELLCIKQKCGSCTGNDCLGCALTNCGSEINACQTAVCD
jgi:hypothetical protein